MEPAGVAKPPGRAWWRTPVVAGLTLALLVLGGGILLQYRRDHRDEWRHFAHPWHHVEVSEDGRTLTFVAYPGSSSYQPDGVTFDRDPSGGGMITATLRMKVPAVVDGHPAFASLDLGRLPATVVVLDEPVPAGTVFVDSTTPRNSFVECAATRQVVGEPTTDVDSSSCGP